MSAHCCEESLTGHPVAPPTTASLSGEPRLDHRLYQAGTLLAIVVFLLSLFV